MTQAELNRQVAQTTGENVNTIANMGFGLADPVSVNFDPEPYDRPPLLIDWDDLDAQRHALVA